jgi:OHCU decarboxylase
VHSKNATLLPGLKPKYTLAEINSFSRERFVEVFGSTFEHSPWVAETTWDQRPFTDFDNLHRELCLTVHRCGEERQLALICAHPDLVGNAALAGTLTRASSSEQASAGLDKLAPEEIRAFQANNNEYREKFGFPFVICARLNKREAILKGFQTRLKNSRREEIQTALEEIGKIAYLRLRDLIDVDYGSQA